MKLKIIAPVVLLFASVLLVQGATAIFDDYWNKTMSDEGWVPGAGNLFPDGDGTTPEFAPWPFGDRPTWNATPRFDFNDSAYERFGQRLPDRDDVRSRYFFNGTPIRPGSGDHIFPDWNGTKPRFLFNDTSSWPFGSKVIPDGNSTKPGFFFTDTSIVPGSGNGMMPGWNGRKPSVFSDDTGDGPQMGTRVLAG
jgi:hypothetical protein